MAVRCRAPADPVRNDLRSELGRASHAEGNASRGRDRPSSERVRPAVMDFETLWEATIGLIVEDGWIAIGAIGALAATWLVTVLARSQGNEELLILAGPLLLGMIIALILSNLYAA